MQINASKLISNSSPYPFAEIDKQVALLKKQGKKIIDFGVGDPSSPVPNFVIESLHKGAKKRAESGYPSYIGSLEFRQACAKYLKKNFNATLNPETEITSSIGSKETIFHFPLGFINPNDIVICPTPGYPPYKTGTRFARGIPYFTPLTAENNFLIDFESIPKEIVKRAKIIWINYPNSPTGKCAPREWLGKLIKWARKHNIIIAADEGCYIDIYFDKKPISILELEKEGIVAFYSLSKRNNMTGYRVGFCAGDERIISTFKKVKTNIDSGTPTFIQDAAISALEDEKHVKLMRKEYGVKRNIMLKAFAQAGFPLCESEATFYLWQKAPQGMDGVELAKKMLKLNMVVTPGAWISDLTDQGGNPGKDYVRFALVPTLNEIKEAGRRIGNRL